jgi:hypothetical protein
MALQKVLLKGEPLAAGAEKRLLPSLDVSKWDRLHFHISGGTRSIADLSVRVLFGTPVDGKILLTDSTVWFEDTVWEREFSHTTPANYGGTGLVMSVPVVAPLLYDVILRNLGANEKPEVYVTVLAQEI